MAGANLRGWMSLCVWFAHWWRNERVAAGDFFLLRYQNIWLERRCNDAERGWRVAEWLFNISLGLVAISMILPPLALPIIALGWLQFAYGLCLPANPLPNASGYPRPDTPALQYGAWAAGVLAVALPVVLLV